MSKPQHRPEWKIQVVKEYLSGAGSYVDIGRAHGISRQTVRVWVQRYQEHGEAGFICEIGNKHYSREFKIKCVNAVLCGEGSVDDIALFGLFKSCVKRISVFFGCWMEKKLLAT